MAHHKRGRPRSARAGCLSCKPHKANQLKDAWGSQTRQEQGARHGEEEQRDALEEDPHEATLTDEDLERALRWERPPRLRRDASMREEERRRAADGR